MTKKVFVDRRQGGDRRLDPDPCSTLPMDLYHRKRRKRPERRQNRTLAEDYQAFTNEPLANAEQPSRPRN